MAQVANNRPRFPAYAQPRPVRYLQSPLVRYGGPIDCAFAIAILLAVLFNAQLGPLTPLTILAVVPLFMWVRRNRMAGIAARCWPLLLVPGFALLSAVWSIQPQATLRYATLYLVTVLAGIFIGAGLSGRSQIVAIAVAFTAYNAVAFLFGKMTPWEGAMAFAGLSHSKNLAGSVAVIGIMGSLACLALASSRRSRLLMILSIAPLAPCAWITWASHATGAQVGGGAGIVCLILWLTTRYLPLQVRWSIFIVTAILIVAIVMTQSLWMPALFDFVLESSGKDSGLTGRGDIWRKADQLISRRPVLGLGFGAFWIPGNLDAEALWRQFGIGNKSGFSFHHTQREITVGMGYVGFFLAVIVAAGSTMSLFLRSLVKPDFENIFFSAFLVYSTLRLGTEVFGIGSMQFETILLFAAFAVGLRRQEPPPTSSPVHSHIASS
ncbi:MAG: O-Antigen ligase [Sphingomonas bacterium]|nr:O-Antigen ligase [Sphingomonas bacterium]